MVETGKMKNLVEVEEPQRGANISLLSKYNIPITHLDFDYVSQCKDGKELEKILKILQSGEEGYYPDLMKVTEDRLMQIMPKSKALRKVKPVLRKNEIDKEEWNSLANDLNQWVSTMTENSKELEAQKINTHDVVDVPLRTNKAEALDKNNEVATTKRIASTDYESWDKYDVETELLKMDLKEEKLKKEATKMSKPDKTKEHKQQPKLKEFRTNAEALFEANREKEKGNEFFKAGDYEDALDHYNNSIFYAPSAATYTNRAIANMKLEKYDSALYDCEQALKIDPNNLKAHLRKAYSLEALKRFEEALKSVETVIRIDPNNAAAQQLAQKIQSSSESKMEKKRFQIIDVDNNNCKKSEKQITKKKVNQIIKKNEKQTTIPIPGTSKMSPPFYKTVKTEDPRIVLKETIKIQNLTPQLIHLTKIEEDGDDDCLTDHLKMRRNTVQENKQDITENNSKLASEKSQEKIVSVQLQNDVGGGGEPYSEEIITLNEDNLDINTPYAFLKAWYAINRRDVSYVGHANIIKNLEINRIHEVIGNKLDSQMLSDLLKCLYLHFMVAGEEERVRTVLCNIPLIPRFNIVSLFMTESDRSCVRSLVQFLNQHGKILPEHIIKLYI